MKRSVVCGVFTMSLISAAFPASAQQSERRATSDRPLEGKLTHADAGMVVGCDISGGEQYKFLVEHGVTASSSSRAQSPALPSITPDPQLVAACDGAHAAISKINADPNLLARLDALVEAEDSAGARVLLSENGLTDAILPGASFHAVNTKGTGAQGGNRAVSLPSSNPMPSLRIRMSIREFSQLQRQGIVYIR